LHSKGGELPGNISLPKITQTAEASGILGDIELVGKDAKRGWDGPRSRSGKRREQKLDREMGNARNGIKILIRSRKGGNHQR